MPCRLRTPRLLGLVLCTALASDSPAEPDPLRCEGYPESRVFLESQSWWSDDREPFPGAHVHVGTCFPLNQSIDGIVRLDLRLILHNDPGETSGLRIQVRETDPVTDKTVDAFDPVEMELVWRCPQGETCVRWETLMVDTTQATSDGRKEFRITLNIPSTPAGPNEGNRQFQTTRWHATLANGGGRPVRDYQTLDRTGAAGWYTGSEYTNVRIRGDHALQAAYGSVCGTWSPELLGEKDRLVVSIDATNHGQDPGSVVYDGPGDGVWRRVDIDTAALADGEHKLFLRADDLLPNGTSSGLFVLPFLVAPSSTPSETSCSDGVDDDCDGANDCADPDCSQDTACLCDNDGLCELGEDCLGCPHDCPGGTCGNGTCDVADGEDCVSCPLDCNGRQGGRPSGRFCCGDGDGKSPVPCSDGRCSSGGFVCSDAPAVTVCCGDAICQEGEDGSSCALDCGPTPACGDGTCSASEDACTCVIDCGHPPALEGICSDGVDEDCDGRADCDDADCAGDASCVCVPAKGACSRDGDCCSENCRGGVCRGGG